MVVKASNDQEVVSSRKYNYSMLIPTCTMYLRNTIFTMIIGRDRSEPSDHEMHVLRKNRIETIRRQIRNNRNVHVTFKIRVLNVIVAVSRGFHILTSAAWHIWMEFLAIVILVS